jgi:hypothetical protein
MRKMLVILVFMLAMPALSQEVEPYNAIKNGQSNGFGVGGGHPWWGFLYRRNFGNDLGVSVSLGGHYWNYGYGSERKVGSGELDLGSNLLYTVAHHAIPINALPEFSIRVNILVAARMKYSAGERSHYENSVTTYKPYQALNLGLGFGPGMELFFDRHFALHLELPWMTYGKIENRSFRFDSSYPRIGGGFIYYI